MRKSGEYLRRLRDYHNVDIFAKSTILTNQADEWFKTLIQESQYIGDVYSISYETARVLVHDHFRQEVGGIPSLSFLIATRVKPNQTEIDYTLEDSSIILLRVRTYAVPIIGVGDFSC